MKVLSILEKKITTLVELIKKLQAENAALVQEKAELVAQLKAMESSVLDDSKKLQQFGKEKSETKSAVDDLIGIIDSLVETENQQ